MSRNDFAAYKKPAERLALLGVIFIFGGESYCILGPLCYERIIRIVCHAILYSGIALVGLAVALYLAKKKPDLITIAPFVLSVP